MNPQLVVWWTLWAAFQVGIFMIYFFLGKFSSGGGASAESITWLAAITPVLFSAAIRWVILPRVAAATAALPLFIVGIALAEATCFLGLFIFPPHKLELFILSAFGIFQFIPYYAGRFVDGGGE